MTSSMLMAPPALVLGIGSLRWPELQLACGKEHPYTAQLAPWPLKHRGAHYGSCSIQHLGLSGWGLLLCLLSTGLDLPASGAPSRAPSPPQGLGGVQ